MTPIWEEHIHDKAATSRVSCARRIVPEAVCLLLLTGLFFVPVKQFKVTHSSASALTQQSAPNKGKKRTTPQRLLFRMNDGSGGSLFSISWWHHSTTRQNLSEIQVCLGYTYRVQRESKAGLRGAFPTSQHSAGQGGRFAVSSEASLVYITRLPHRK